MRQKLFTIINGLSLLIMITSCIVVYDYYENPTGWYDLALIFLPLTCILTFFLLHRLSLNPPTQDRSKEWQSFTRWQIASCIMGVICILVLTLIHQPEIEVDHKLQFFLWLSGLGLITAGVTRGIPLQQIRAWTKEPDARWLLLIVLIGLFLRIFLLETAIPRYIDEVNFAEGIHWLRENPNFKILTNTSGITNFALVYFYYIYTELFGATLANLRAIGVLAGVLTIPSVYLLGRWAFTRRVGLLGAFLLAIDIPHIHFSRLAMSNIVDPLFGVLAIAFLWRGLQTRSWRWLGWGLSWHDKLCL